MSMHYGAVYGYGIAVDGLGDRIVSDKFVKFAKEKGLWLDEYDDRIDSDYIDSTLILDCLETYYMSLEEMFADVDETGLLDYDSGMENGGYLLYYPSYPWSNNCWTLAKPPETREQVDDAIVKAIQKLTDLTEDEIESRIGYISDAYYG